MAAARQASLSITNSRSLPKLTSIESMIPTNHLILCHPLFLPPSIFPSIKVFSNKSVLCIRWPKHWSFSFSISPTNEHPVLISFMMDWLDLPAVQGTLKSLLQHHSSKASVLLCLSFFTVQLSHPYMTTGKTIALTRWTFAGKVMSLLFNMLSRLVITFLPRSKHLLISWLQCSDAHLTSHSRMSGSRWVITPSWLSGLWRSFLYSSVYSCYLFLMSSASVIPFLSPIVAIFAWNVPLVSLIFMKRSLVFPIPLFFSISCTDHWRRLSYLSLLFFGTYCHPKVKPLIMTKVFVNTIKERTLFSSKVGKQ